MQWDQEFKFEVKIGTDFVAFDVYDEDTIGRDDHLGSAILSKAELQTLQQGVEKSYELKLSGVKKGVIYVSTCRHNIFKSWFLDIR